MNPTHPSNGSCTLVGAGPGDPELLTLKAVKAIARATKADAKDVPAAMALYVFPTVAEQLGVRVKRLGAPRIPVGYAPVLEAVARVSVEQIVAAAQDCLKSVTR